MKDRWYAPALLLLLLMALADIFVSFQTRHATLSGHGTDFWVRLTSLLHDAVYLPVSMIVFGRYRLGRQVEARESDLFKIEQSVRRETRRLEQTITERTAELQAEVEERRRADLLNRGRNQVLEMLAQNNAMNPTLEILLTTITEQRSSWVGTIHELGGKTLQLCASVGIPEMLIEHLQRINVAFEHSPEASSLVRRSSYTIEDTRQERTPWCQLLSANGILSAMSHPFFSADGVVLGTMTIYSRLRSKPTERDHELLEMACSMAALVFEHKRLHQQLMVYAYHDALTGLPNRRLGEDRLELAIAQSKRAQTQVAILWIDLDRFKHINDAHGHPIGDQVLKDIAFRVSGRLRETDTMARMGGDEFMIILSGVQSRDTAEETASELHKIVTAPMLLDGIELNVTISIGISMYPEDGNTAELLKQSADRAMYQAKVEHVGTRSFSPMIGIEAAELRELTDELTQAIKSDGFEIDYQPQFKADGSIVGFEALLRFRHPRLGAIPPSKFIPIAEEEGLIVPLGEWVLRNVCLQSMEWRHAGYKQVPIAVNISALQFARSDFAETVRTILTETGLNPAFLELELTESVVMKDPFESSRQLEELSRIGVTIAVDDFGTGYSSLSYLHQLPIDVLKIDRSFVEKMTDIDGTRAIVEAIISMAHTLGLRVVAEGVETLAQLRLLEQSRCDTIQGYYFSSAVRPKDAASFLVEQHLDSGEKLSAADHKQPSKLQ